jgi:hypothetical protein
MTGQFSAKVRSWGNELEFELEPEVEIELEFGAETE